MKKLLTSFFLITLLSWKGYANDRILYFNKPADTPQARYVIELLETAYKALDYKLKIIEFNHKSSLIAANEGVLDGQLGRIAAIEADYPNLKRIDLPLYRFNLQVMTLCTQCQLEDYKSIVIQSGYPVARTYLSKHSHNAQVIEVQNVESQLNLVMQGRIDAAIILDFHLNQHLPYIDLDGFKIENILAIESFHFLHKRHQDLLPLVRKELQKLKQNGVMYELKAKYQI